MRTVLIAAGVAAAFLAAKPTGGNGVAGTWTPSVRLQAASPQAQATEQMRFREMDTNRDGVISRAEWRGSAQSFRVHDWNGDGVLSVAEVREGGRAERPDDPDYAANNNVNNDWSVRHFRQLDHDSNGRITRQRMATTAAITRPMPALGRINFRLTSSVLEAFGCSEI